MDCFEPNDTAGEAAAIVLDIPVEAYVVAGYRDEDRINANQPAWYDWYSFTLDSSTSLGLELRAVPSNVRLRAALFSADLSLLHDEIAPAAGATFNVDLVNGMELTEGTYLLRVHPHDVVPRAVHLVAGAPAIPAHFDEPYELLVVRR